MSEISTISTKCHLVSKTRASLESIKEKKAIEAAGVNEVNQFRAQLEQVDRGLALAKEIHHTLESMLKD
ncbi:MAG: hypothetical protein WAM28_01480 [Chlamydiales bacterium]